MSSTTAAVHTAGGSYLTDGHSLKSWLLTKDHKRIGILYMISITLFFALGGLFAGAIRLELLTPDGDMFQPDTYNRLFTLHGIVMIFFFLVPSIPATLGNFLLPLMIGAKDLAFPKINLASWYLYNVAGILTLWAIFHGGVDTGWTFYTPFSTTYSNSYVVLVGVAIFIAGFSSIFTGLNFIVTIHRMRAPGLTWFRLPLFVWAHYATSLIILLGTPVLAIAVLLVAVERGFGIGIFDPALGGDPILFQHLFWFYSHPAVYIMILPSMGVISELVAAFAKKRVFGYHFVAFASLAIAVLGFLVWGHHMFVSGQSVYAGLVFSVLSMLVAIPSAVKVFNWTATLYEGSVSLQTPMLYALGFIGLFTLGGLTGTMIATLGIDVHVHDTYFIVAHFHYVLFGGSIFALTAGAYYWWPKMFGRMLDEGLGKVHFWLSAIFINVTFFPQHFSGLAGMQRRVPDYAVQFVDFNMVSTIGAFVFFIAQFIFIFNMLASCYGWFGRARNLPDRVWEGARGLEWTVPSPAPLHTFHTPPRFPPESEDYNDDGRAPAHG